MDIDKLLNDVELLNDDPAYVDQPEDAAPEAEPAAETDDDESAAPEPEQVETESDDEEDAAPEEPADIIDDDVPEMEAGEVPEPEEPLIEPPDELDVAEEPVQAAAEPEFYAGPADSVKPAELPPPADVADAPEPEIEPEPDLEGDQPDLPEPVVEDFEPETPPEADEPELPDDMQVGSEDLQQDAEEPAGLVEERELPPVSVVTADVPFTSNRTMSSREEFIREQMALVQRSSESLASDLAREVEPMFDALRESHTQTTIDFMDDQVQRAAIFGRAY